MASLMSAMFVVVAALLVMMISPKVDAHRLCGFKLAKIIRQVCDMAECDWSDELLKLEIDDEQALSEKCCAHPSGCTLDYIQKWCCLNQNKYELSVDEEPEKRVEHIQFIRPYKKPSLSASNSKRTRSRHEHHAVDDQFINLLV